MSMLKIYIVDDSKVQCTAVANLVRQIMPKAVVTTEHNAKIALDYMRVNSVDIALIDLEMPEMDGVELIHHLATESLCRATIIMSAKPPSLLASVAVMAESQGLTVLGALHKPLSDAALRNAINAHKNRKTPELKQTNDAFNFSTMALMDAVANKQFINYYQPKVELHHYHPVGVEALARWQHPQKGVLSPFYFIEKMEKSGLIDALTLQLFDDSLANKQRWNRELANFDLAVNLSTLSLVNTSFPDWVYDHVQEFGIAPGEITFEVTENALIRDVAKAIQTLARLRLKGFNIAIDDYGTGYANAEQLARIPATTLKLDRSMIHGVAAKGQLEKVLRSTVILAKELDMTTVAEGVELEDDLQLVKNLGIDQVQGFIFAKPMPVAELESWIKHRQPKPKG